MEDEQFEDDFVVASGSPDFRSELAAQLAELAPEVIADGKVDVAKLQELLGEDVADSAERFGLFWPGKKNALRVAQAPTTATLRPDIENSKDWDTTQNVFIEGDNLEVLKILQKHYHNKIKMIYIDPPYNTGNDFVYPDNFKEGLDSYLEWTRQVNEEGKKLSSNSETEGRYHSNWLNMMYPRLKLARNLLTDDGSVAISIDDNEITNLRKLCDEVFGESNFVAQVIVQANKGGRDYLPMAQTHEYCLVYAKNYSTNGIHGLTKDESNFPYKDSKGNYDARDLRNRNPRFHRGNRPNLFYPFYVNPTQVDEYGFSAVSVVPDERFSIEIVPQNSEGADSCWRWGKPKSSENLVFDDPINSQLVAKQVRSGKWNVYEKNRLSTQKAKTIWDETEVRTEAGTRLVRELFGASVFDHPKPVDLIKKIISISTELANNDIVLDFFAGSSSAAHAAMMLNAEDGGSRRFVMVQLPEPTPEDSEARKAGYETIADISRERIRRAGAAIVAEREGQLDSGEKPLDVGFRSYKLNTSNFAKWQVTSDVEAGKLGEHLMSLRGSADDDATPDDLLTEVLLKQGYSLTEQISKVDIAGLELHSVGDGLVLAYLNEHVKPTLEQFRAVVDSGPSRLIVLEDAYQSDDQLKTNLEQLCKSKSIELWRA